MLPRVEDHYKKLLEGKQKRIDQLSALKNELTSKNKVLQQYSEEFKKKFENELEKCQTAYEQIELLKDAKSQLMQRLQQTTNDCKTLAQEIVSSTQARDEWRQQAELYSREKNELERQLNEMKKNAILSHQHFSNQFDEMNNEKESLRQSLQQTLSELENEKKQCEQFKQENTTLSHTNERMQSEVIQLRSEIEKSRQVNADLKNQLASISQERMLLSDQLVNISGDTNRLDGERSVLSQQVKELQLEVTQLQEQCRGQESELLCSRSELQETRGKIQLLESENQILEQKIQVARAEQANMDRIVSDSRQALLEVQSEFELHKNEYQATSERMEIIHNRLKEKTNANLELMKERDQLLSTIEDLQFLEEINTMQQERIAWLENEMKCIEHSGHTKDIQSMFKGMCSQEEAISMARQYETKIQILQKQLQAQQCAHQKELEDLRRLSKQSDKHNRSEETLMDITNTSQPMDQSQIYKSTNRNLSLQGSFFTTEIM